MLRFRSLAVALLMFSIGSVASAETITMQHGVLTATDLSTATATNAAAYTGWIDVDGIDTIMFEITYVFSTASIVTMSCQTSEVSSTTDAAGWDVPALSTASGTSTSVVHTWSNAVSANEKWSWKVSGMIHRFIQCVFNGTGAGAADTVVVKYKTVSP